MAPWRAILRVVQGAAGLRFPVTAAAIFCAAAFTSFAVSISLVIPVSAAISCG